MQDIGNSSAANNTAVPTQQQATQHQQQQLQPQQHLRQQWRVDRLVGMISIAMWIGTAFRVMPALTLWENAQSVTAIATMYLTVIAWPTYATASYTRWRLPVLAFLRVFLVALPYNFSTSVFDAIAPTVATGRFAAIANSFQAFLAVRVALLTFTSLGWRVPFRLHLLLQTVNVGLLVCFGLHPYCNSKLMSSPQLQGTAAAVHKAMGLFASMLLPSMAGSGRHAPLSPAKDPGTQCLAFLLFCWAVLGWLLPTLLLLPAAAAEADTPAAARQPSWTLWRLASSVADKVLVGIERGLGTLQPPRLWSQRVMQRRLQDDAAPDRDNADVEGEESLTMIAAFVLAWCVVLLATWLGSCSLAVFRMGSDHDHDQ